MVDQGQDEQWIPARSVGAPCPPEFDRERCREVRYRSWIELHPALSRSGRTTWHCPRIFIPMRQRFQGLPGPGSLSRTIRADQHQLSGIIAAGERFEQGERRIVGPMQVIEGEDERARGS